MKELSIEQAEKRLKKLARGRYCTLEKQINPARKCHHEIDWVQYGVYVGLFDNANDDSGDCWGYGETWIEALKELKKQINLQKT